MIEFVMVERVLDVSGVRPGRDSVINLANFRANPFSDEESFKGILRPRKG